VIELFKGGTLFEKIIREGNLSERESSFIILHIMSALKYVHRKGYFLRNLRPENVVFMHEEASADIKLIDLMAICQQPSEGLVVASDNQCRAPEMLIPNAEYTNKVDSWSCGVILFNMVTGVPPFFESTPDLLDEKIKQGVFSV